MKMSNEWLSESFWLWWDRHPRVGVPIHSDSGDEMGELASLDSSAFSLQALDSARSVKQAPWLQLHQKAPMPLSGS